MHSFDAASRSAICFFSITYSNVLSIPLVQPITEHCFRIRFYIRLCVVLLTSQSGLMLPFLDAWMDFNFPVFDEWSRANLMCISFQSRQFFGLCRAFFTHTLIDTRKRKRKQQHNRDNILMLYDFQMVFKNFFCDFLFFHSFTIHFCKLWVIVSLLIPVCLYSLSTVR